MSSAQVHKEASSSPSSSPSPSHSSSPTAITTTPTPALWFGKPGEEAWYATEPNHHDVEVLAKGLIGEKFGRLRMVPATLLEAIKKEIDGATASPTSTPRHLRKPAWLSLAYADPGMLKTIQDGNLSEGDRRLLQAMIKMKMVSFYDKEPYPPEDKLRQERH